MAQMFKVARPRCLSLLLHHSPSKPLLSSVAQTRGLSTSGAVSKMQKSNRLRTSFMNDEGPSFGLWQMLPGANVSRALTRANVDWVMIDCEHGNIDGEYQMV